MPKKAVAIFFIAAFIGAAIFIYFTFPRTKNEIPRSNNQPPIPSAPSLPQQTPNGLPVPEPAPRPDTPKVPPGPKLHVMAWATGREARALQSAADAFTAATGRGVSLTLEADETAYRHDLQAALESDSPPDLCLISARDFSGLDPAHDLAVAKPGNDTEPRSIAAFTSGGQIRAVPAEFSVDLLYYNTAYFDQAGLGYPGEHWTWDMLEAISRALSSLQLKDKTGQPVYPLELPANFDLWNTLSAQSGTPVLDLDIWHLSEPASAVYQTHALDFVRRLFNDLSVTAPLPKEGDPAGRLFAQQRASLLIASSELTATLPKIPFDVTLPPGYLNRASLARLNGWAIPARSLNPDSANALAVYLAWAPIHTGWSSVHRLETDDAVQKVCHEALAQAVIPRYTARTAPLARTLDRQIAQLASGSTQKPDQLYALIQSEYRSDVPGAGAPAADRPGLLTPASMPLRTGP